MESKQLFIPDNIKVGYVNRQDTYTGKLAFVIYYDKKGELRQEKSWQGWRDKKIAPVDFPNEATEGFVLNKGVGGQRQSYGWNARNEYIRVYDPRDFEFEISVANLLFILRECDCSRGKGLEGKFVYAWDGKDIVLLPAISEDYKQSKEFTNLQDQKVAAKDLIPGATYVTKKQEELLYLGRFNYHYVIGKDYYRRSYDKDEMERVHQKELKDKGFTKKHVFWEPKRGFQYFNELKTIAVLKTDVAPPNYTDLVDQYNKSAHGSAPVRLFLKPEKVKQDKNYRRQEEFSHEVAPGQFMECYTAYDRVGHYPNYTEKLSHVGARCIYEIVGEKLVRKQHHATAYKNPRKKQEHHSWYGGRIQQEEVTMPWVEPTENQLWIELASGSKRKFVNSDFQE